MAGSKSTSRKSRGKKNEPVKNSKFKRDLWLIGALAICILLFLSFLGLIGPVGLFFSKFFFGLFGIGAYAFPFIFFVSYLYLSGNKHKIVAKIRVLCISVIYVFIGVFTELFSKDNNNLLAYSIKGLYSRGAGERRGGGVIFGSIAFFLNKNLDKVGAVLISIIFILGAIIIITGRSLIDSIREGSSRVYDSTRESARVYRREMDELNDRRENDRIERRNRRERLREEEDEYREGQNSRRNRRALCTDEEFGEAANTRRRARSREYDIASNVREDNIPRRHREKSEEFRFPTEKNNGEPDTRRKRRATGISEDAVAEDTVKSKEVTVKPLQFRNEMKKYRASDDYGFVSKTDKYPEPAEQDKNAVQYPESEYKEANDNEPEYFEPEMIYGAEAAEEPEKRIEYAVNSSPFDKMVEIRFEDIERKREAEGLSNIKEPVTRSFENVYTAREYSAELIENKEIPKRVWDEGCQEKEKNIPEIQDFVKYESKKSEPEKIVFEDHRSGEYTYDSGAYEDRTYGDGTYDGSTYEDGTYGDGTYDGGTHEDGTHDGGIYKDDTYVDRTYEDCNPEYNKADSKSENCEFENSKSENSESEKSESEKYGFEDSKQENQESADREYVSQEEISFNSLEKEQQTDIYDSSYEEKNKIGNCKPRAVHSYQFPALSLLSDVDTSLQGSSREELTCTANSLKETLDVFGVKTKITDISQGPRVTRYELQPELGVRVNKIVQLEDDIKLALAAQDIRIEAPIPGKAAVGIEIPNKESIPVRLRELFESEEFKSFGSRIPFAVGKDIGGNVIVTDIAKMPHMLIAGSTGSGKSICINTIIMSILYKASPDEVKLIMVDPKQVELGVYNGIPHLLLPVVTDAKKASAALNWAVAEMMDRFQKFAQKNVRDLKGYNKIAEEKLPQIVIIVDELADLMMVAAKEVEESICRIAQLARACGIHLIVATQRPSVDVITGLIKANMPSRVAFRVASGTDSRTILDMVGAERLLGAGDMLFYPQGYSKPVRMQGAFVSDDEVLQVVDYLKAQNLGNTYSESMEKVMQALESNSQAADRGSANEFDELLGDVGRFIINSDKASTSAIQRKFKVGFNRAARIMDQLCELGVVSEEMGTKPRDIIMSPESFEELLDGYL